jgi:uncharacterized membrane protein YphA (DoxX/SURF4 family)
MISILIVLARVSVGALFLFAGWIKLRAGVSHFFSDLLAYDLLPLPATKLLASVLPLVEVVIGGLLIVGFLTPVVTTIGMFMLLVFTGAVAIALLRHKEISCGCFGRQVNIQQERWIIFSRNIVMLTVLGVTLTQKPTVFAFDTLFLSETKYVWWFSSIGIIFCLLIIYLFMRWYQGKKETSTTSI